MAKRGSVVVSFKLDPVPGWGHAVEDWQELIQRHLDNMVGHYEPVVSLVPKSTCSDCFNECGCPKKKSQ